MCYLEDCTDVVEYIENDLKEQLNRRYAPKKDKQIIIKMDKNEDEDDVRINHIDLDTFFRSIGSIFITYITSSTLNNLLLSQVIKTNNIRCGVNILEYMLCNSSLLSIFSSELDMIERCKLFNSSYISGADSSNNIECCIWNISYFNLYAVMNDNIFNNKYNHKLMMKMMITYICINGMHPFLGIDCDNSPNCQWSDNPKCRIRHLFEKLLANSDEYDFGYRDAFKMRTDSKKLLIDVKEMMQFLFLKRKHENIMDNDNEEKEELFYFDIDGFKSFENDKFTLFTFKNECDFTYKIQFDIIHCDSNLNIIDDFKISLFGKKINFGTIYDNNKAKNYWQKMKNILLGHKFVNIKNWYIISIQSIDTSLNGVETNKCYYLICAEVDGTWIQKKSIQFHQNNHNQMKSKLLVWKSCFYSEQQPYGHE